MKRKEKLGFLLLPYVHRNEFQCGHKWLRGEDFEVSLSFEFNAVVSFGWHIHQRHPRTSAPQAVQLEDGWPKIGCKLAAGRRTPRASASRQNPSPPEATVYRLPFALKGILVFTAPFTFGVEILAETISEMLDLRCR